MRMAKEDKRERRGWEGEVCYVLERGKEKKKCHKVATAKAKKKCDTGGAAN